MYEVEAIDMPLITGQRKPSIAPINIEVAPEEEKDDGRLHNLEIRVKAKDAKGKLRKLEVNSRRGYYMTTVIEKEVTASKTQ